MLLSGTDRGYRNFSTWTYQNKFQTTPAMAIVKAITTHSDIFN
jgi:hypothetical protein